MNRHHAPLREGPPQVCEELTRVVAALRRLAIRRGKDDAGHTGEQRRGLAHRTRLGARSEQCAVEAGGSEGPGRRPDRHHLGMGSRVVLGKVLVDPFADVLASEDDDSAERPATSGGVVDSELDCVSQPRLVVHTVALHAPTFLSVRPDRMLSIDSLRQHAQASTSTRPSSTLTS